MPKKNNNANPNVKLADLTPGQLRAFLKKQYNAITDPMKKMEFAVNAYFLAHDQSPLTAASEKLADAVTDFLNYDVINAPDENGNIDPERIKATMRDLSTYLKSLAVEYSNALDENKDDPLATLNTPLSGKIDAIGSLCSNLQIHVDEDNPDPAWARYNLAHPEHPIVLADLQDEIDQERLDLYRADPDGAKHIADYPAKEKEAFRKIGIEGSKARGDYVLDVSGKYAAQLYEEFSSQIPPLEELDDPAPDSMPAKFDQNRYARLYNGLKDLKVGLSGEDAREYQKTLAALNVLGHDIFSDSRSVQTEYETIRASIRSKEEAWDQIHRNKNFEKLLHAEVTVENNGVSQTMTLAQAYKQSVQMPQKQQQIEEDLAYIKSHSQGVGQFVGDEDILDKPVLQFGGLDRISDHFNDENYKNFGKDLQFSEIDHHAESVLSIDAVENQLSDAGRVLYNVLTGRGDEDFDLVVQLDNGASRITGLKRVADVLRNEISPEVRRSLGVKSNDTIVSAYRKVRNSEEYKKICEKHADDPVFRHGLHVMKQLANHIQRNAAGAKTSESIDQDEAGMNEQILQRTLAPMSAQQVKDLNNELRLGGDTEKLSGAIEQNMAKQNTVAKMLFMAHLGSVDLEHENEQGNRELTKHFGSMSDLLAHGYRVKYNLPKGTHQKQMFDSIVGKDYGKNDGVYHIKASTRSLSTQRFTRQGTIEYLSEERASSYNIFNNYAMDLPLGGLGSRDHDGHVRTDKNIPSRTYLKMVKGGARDAGGLLFSLSPKTDTAQTTFFSERGGYGDPDNGRVVNLYRLKDQDFTNLMDRFDSYYRKLQKDAMSDPEKAKELTEVNGMLTGKQMEKQSFTRFMIDKLGISGYQANKIFDQMRMDEDVVLQDDEYISIPPKDDPNAGKTREQIRNEEADRKAVFENAIESKLYENEFYETYGEQAAEEMAVDDDDFNVSMDFDENDAAIKHGWVPVAQQKAQPLAGSTLQEYLDLCAHRLSRSNKAKEQDKLICSMISAVYQTGGALSTRLDPANIDPDKIAKIPSIAYQLKHSRPQVLQSAMQGRVDNVFSQTQNLNELLKGGAYQEAILQDRLKAIYDKMNVPNLKSRSEEYQKMVKAVHQLSKKEKISGEDKIRLINAVEHYASLKRVVPRSTGGKVSLDLGFQAMEAVIPQNEGKDEAWNTFMAPHTENIAQLRTEMERKGLRQPDQLHTESSSGPQNEMGGPRS